MTCEKCKQRERKSEDALMILWLIAFLSTCFSIALLFGVDMMTQYYTGASVLIAAVFIVAYQGHRDSINNAKVIA